MRLRLFGVTVRISYFVLLFFLLLLIRDATGYFGVFLLCVALHESGHLLAMTALRCPPHEIRIHPGGCCVIGEFYGGQYGTWISLAGPAVNLLCAGMIFLGNKALGTHDAQTFAEINLALGCFNLLPLPGLDGGELLYTALRRHCGDQTVKRVKRFVVLCAVAAVVCIGLAAYEKGYSLINYGLILLYFLAYLCVKI